MARHEGVETVSGRMTLAFGAVSFPISRDRDDAVHLLELLLAGGIAGTFGLLMTLVWTAGFVPTFLEPGAAVGPARQTGDSPAASAGQVLRRADLRGFQVVLFVALTWLALGLRTGVWDVTYWWCVPLLLVEFAIFYSFSILLAVSPEHGRLRLRLAPVLAAGLGDQLRLRDGSQERPIERRFPCAMRTLAEVSYWISPKPIDQGLIFFNALDSPMHFVKPSIFKQALEAWPAYSPAASIISSLMITGVLLLISVREFRAADYSPPAARTTLALRNGRNHVKLGRELTFSARDDPERSLL